MKKIALFIALAILAVGMANAKAASQLKVYIDPGHGSWGSEDRNMALVNKGLNDSTGFYETNTNMRKGLALYHKLRSYGLTANGNGRDLSQHVVMSHVRCNPVFPAASFDGTYSRNLSVIAAEAEQFGGDMFISVHSNGFTEGSTTNYPLFLYRGTDSDVRAAGSDAMARACWPYAFGNTHQVWTYYSLTNMNIRGDVSLMGSDGGVTNSYSGITYWGYYGVLKHGTPGFLVEGYFHTYQPARHRAMNWDVDYIEGYCYARGIADYFGVAKESTGDIYGIVRSADEASSTLGSLYTANSSSDDVYLPLNGATVTLKNSSGTTVKTYTTDGFYNGAFVFKDIAPGTYTVTASKSGYDSNTFSVTVTASQTTYTKTLLDASGQTVNPYDEGTGYYSYYDSKMDGGWPLNYRLNYDDQPTVSSLDNRNSFAYDVVTSLSTFGCKVRYRLAGVATAVTVKIFDSNGIQVAAVPGTLNPLNEVTVSLMDQPNGTYKASVEVTSANHGWAKCGTTYRFFSPWGVTCNNCTESPTFGRVLCLESNVVTTTRTTDNPYHSGVGVAGSTSGSGNGMGIYAFTPQGQPMFHDAAAADPNNAPNINSNNQRNYYCFRAGMSPVTNANSARRLDFKRIKFSADGRLFLSRTNMDATVATLYELNPNNLEETANPVFTGAIDTYGSVGGNTASNSNGPSDSRFVANQFCGFDVFGKGANLKIAAVAMNMTSGKSLLTPDGVGVHYNAYNWANVSIYNLGTARTWTAHPSQILACASTWCDESANIAIGPNGVALAQRPRDNNGNLLTTGTSDKPNYAFYDTNMARKADDYTIERRGGGIAWNKDHTRLAISSSVGDGTGKLSIYAVSAKGILTEQTSFNTGCNYICAIAWDYADNIYVSSNTSECLNCYSTPSVNGSSRTVATPAAACYDINWEATVPDVYILGTVNGNAWAPNVGVQMTYDATSSSYTATVTAGAGGASFNMATALGSDSNWNNFNGHNYRWGVQGGGDHNVTDAEYGTDLGAQMWDNNPGAWVVPEGEYNITWKFTGEYTATINIEKIETVPDVYILGQVNGNAWASNVGVEMTYNETTGLHSADVFVCKTSDSDNYGYFSFTTALGESWDAISASRFGAVSEGNFLVDGHLGEEISLTATNGQSFKCLAGYYTITVDYKNKKAVISAKSFAPSFNPAPGEYYKVVNIAIASEEVPDADIYVTFHGETPTTESFHLTKELTLTDSYTVKAIAVKYGVVSEVATGEYTIATEPDPSQFEFTKVMETSQNMVAKNDGRFSTGYGDYIYINDKTNGKVVRYDLNGNRSDYASVEGLGTGITSDDAGNIIVNKGFPKADSSSTWVIIEPNGTQHNLSLTFPTGVTAARNDAAGRIVGNVMSSEGGYFCLMPSGNTSAAVFHIANGAQVSASVVAPASTLSADGTTIAQPTMSDISLFAADPTAYWAIRLRTIKAITRAERTSGDGFDIFQLGGNTYTVEPYGNNTYYDGYAIFKDGESEPVAVKEESITTADGQRFQSLTARVSEDGSHVTIYQSVSGALVSIYTYGMPPTGVEKVGNDSQAEETSIAFYTLQGQRIVNPQAGQIAIRVAKMSDGTLRTKKVLVK